MLILFLASFIVAAPPPPRADEYQVLAGPEFEAVVSSIEARCPTSHVRYLKPAEFLYAEEQFDAALPKRRRAALDRALKTDPGLRRCDNLNGASCPAVAELHVYRTLGLTAAFVESVCRHGDAPWN